MLKFYRPSIPDAKVSREPSGSGRRPCSRKSSQEPHSSNLKTFVQIRNIGVGLALLLLDFFIGHDTRVCGGALHKGLGENREHHYSIPLTWRQGLPLIPYKGNRHPTRGSGVWGGLRQNREHLEPLRAEVNRKHECIPGEFHTAWSQARPCLLFHQEPGPDSLQPKPVVLVDTALEQRIHPLNFVVQGPKFRLIKQELSFFGGGRDTALGPSPTPSPQSNPP